MAKPKIPIRTQAERADQSRARILEAAVEAFSQKGLAGARTDQIAKDAGVNKALLYYYFDSKQKLSEAALEHVAGEVARSTLAILNQGESAGERLLRFVLNHFDKMHARQNFQNLMHQEMVQMRHGKSNALPRVIETIFGPMTRRLGQLIEEGQSKGELIACDTWQMMYAALGANIFFFMSSAIVAPIVRRDLLSATELRKRRRTAIEFLSKTVFTNRNHGAHVAERVLASSPMPASNNLQYWRILGPHEEKHT